LKIAIIIFGILLLLFAGVVIIDRIFYRKHDKSTGSIAYPLFFLLVKTGFLNRKKPIFDDARMAEVKKPYLMLVNHESFEDFYYVWQMIKKDKPNYLINEYYTRLPVLRWLAVHGGVLSKKIFTREMTTGLKIHRTLKQGYPVVIFPEGRLSPDGRSNPIVEDGAAFYKRLKCDVVLTKVEGAYLSHPKWRKKYFRSDVRVSVKRVLHPEELREMSNEAFSEIIRSTLYADASVYAHAPYKQKNKAKGLEGILYRCVFCGEKYRTAGRGNDLICTACGKKLSFDETYHFTEWPHSISGYYEEIRKTEREKLGEISLHTKVRLKVFGKNGKYTKNEIGECFLDGESFRYRSASETFTVPVREFPGLAFSCQKEFEFYRGEDLYFFYPVSDPAQVAEWALCVDLLTEKRGE